MNDQPIKFASREEVINEDIIKHEIVQIARFLINHSPNTIENIVCGDNHATIQSFDFSYFNESDTLCFMRDGYHSDLSKMNGRSYKSTYYLLRRELINYHLAIEDYNKKIRWLRDAIGHFPEIELDYDPIMRSLKWEWYSGNTHKEKFFGYTWAKTPCRYNY